MLYLLKAEDFFDKGRHVEYLDKELAPVAHHIVMKVSAPGFQYQRNLSVREYSVIFRIAKVVINNGRFTIVTTHSYIAYQQQLNVVNSVVLVSMNLST